ncbi:MAG TPA: adenylate/guanylate cyclase domain-containing protein, partial [Verrucomicrobiae bacterium]|nr:adenylate/guanylate cyclase domain-containing protein [Verrucomicrobiae bacterium]
EAQRAIYAMNQERFAMTKRIEQENASRAATGLPALPPLALLTLGTGINTGVVTVGLMGSDAHILNYTVFGREVNVASRLEGVSGRGRIIISETTHAALLQDDPTLAATCIPQAATTVKGIRSAIKTYEVPWKETAPAVTAPTSSAPVPPTSPVAPAPPLPPSPPPTQTS